MSDTPTPRTDSLMEEWHHCPPTKQLLNHSRQLERELAEAKANYALAHSGLGAYVVLLSDHKTALNKAKDSLLAVTSGHFYQSSCRGGEMERLMGQAIEALGGGK